MKFRKQWLLIPLPMLVLFIFNMYLTSVWDMYDRYPWIDIPMHFIGGAATAWTFIAGAKAAAAFYNVSFKLTILRTFFVVLAVGLLWELYEYVHDLYSPITYLGTPQDTAFDIILDVAGGLVMAYTLLRKKQKKGE